MRLKRWTALALVGTGVAESHVQGCVTSGLLNAVNTGSNAGLPGWLRSHRLPDCMEVVVPCPYDPFCVSF